MAARKAEEKRRGHRAAVPPARPMRRHRPREGGKLRLAGSVCRTATSHPPPFLGSAPATSPACTSSAMAGKSPMLPTESSVQVRTIQGLPHVRGGVSDVFPVDRVAVRSSPRAWGCFFASCTFCSFGLVFPTRVGVFPCLTVLKPPWRSLPHVRGGVSYSDKVGKEVYGASPRTRGRAWMNALFSLAFPTRMGCFSFIRRGRSAFC